MKLIIYMPALNEEDSITRVINNLPQILPGIDIIQNLVVDDGSVDNTATLAAETGAYVVSHGRNRGVGAAFQSAVQFALENDADILVSIDADDQFDSKEIPMLVAPILAGKADMVAGNRFARGAPENMPRLKYWGNNVVSKILRYASGQKFQDVSCGFRAYNHESLLRLNLFGEFTYTHETILSLIYQGQRVLEQPITVRYYPGRESRLAKSVLMYALQTSKIIFRVMLDYRPLQVFGTLGGILIFIGAAFTLYLLGYYAVTQSFTPYKSFGFIGLGFFIFGLLVLLIALIADMINRIRINQNRQIYLIKKFKYEKK